MSNKIVVVTGGGGYIGTYVVEELLRNGYQVRIFDQFYFGEEILGDLRKNKKLQIFKGGIGDGQKLGKAFKGAWAVVHLAGLVGDPACLVDRDLTIQINVVSTRIVKELAKAFGVERFVFASSCSVYGVSDKLLNESSELNPVSLYARTKIDSEKEILSDKSENFFPTVLRFATVFGHSRRPRFDLVANLFVAQAYHEGVITVTGGNQWRPFIYAKDIAYAIKDILEKRPEIVNREIFNVGDDNLNTTILDLAYLVKKIVTKDKRGKVVQIIVKGDIADTRNYRVSFAKIKKVLGFQASINLKEGLKEIYENFKNGKYNNDYKNPLYVNVEMTKLLQM